MPRVCAFSTCLGPEPQACKTLRPGWGWGKGSVDAERTWGMSLSHTPALSQWIAPTLDIRLARVSGEGPLLVCLEVWCLSGCLHRLVPRWLLPLVCADDAGCVSSAPWAWGTVLRLVCIVHIQHLQGQGEVANITSYNDDRFHHSSYDGWIG